MVEPAEILDTTTIQRNEAIRFASLTLEDLEFIEDAWRTGHPVHLVTQTADSLLGLVVFTCEREYVRFTLKQSITMADLLEFCLRYAKHVDDVIG